MVAAHPRRSGGSAAPEVLLPVSPGPARRAQRDPMVSRGYIHCLRHALARGLILAAFLLCAVTAHAAASNSSIEVSVDRDRVSEGESFVLTFHTETVDHDPDFTPLHTDFDVLGTSRRSDLSLVNGRF